MLCATGLQRVWVRSWLGDGIWVMGIGVRIWVRCFWILCSDVLCERSWRSCMRNRLCFSMQYLSERFPTFGRLAINAPLFPISSIVVRLLSSRLSNLAETNVPGNPFWPLKFSAAIHFHPVGAALDGGQQWRGSKPRLGLVAWRIEHAGNVLSPCGSYVGRRVNSCEAQNLDRD